MGIWLMGLALNSILLGTVKVLREVRNVGLTVGSPRLISKCANSPTWIQDPRHDLIFCSDRGFFFNKEESGERGETIYNFGAGSTPPVYTF